MPAPKFPSTRTAKRKDTLLIFNAPMDLIQEFWQLLDLVNDSELSANVLIA